MNGSIVGGMCVLARLASVNPYEVEEIMASESTVPEKLIWFAVASLIGLAVTEIWKAVRRRNSRGHLPIGLWVAKNTSASLFIPDRSGDRCYLTHSNQGYTLAVQVQAPSRFEGVIECEAHRGPVGRFEAHLDPRNSIVIKLRWADGGETKLCFRRAN